MRNKADVKFASWGMRLFEMAPLILAICVFCKLVYFSLLISDAWWIAGKSRPLTYVISSLSMNLNMISTTLGCLLILSSPLILFGRVSRFIAVVVLDFTFTSLCLAQILYVQFYGDVLSLMNLSTAGMIKEILPSIREPLRKADLFFYLDIMMALLVLPWYFSLSLNIRSPVKSSGRFVSLAFLVFGLILGIPGIRFVQTNRQSMFNDTGLRIDVASAIGILPYHLYDAWVFLRYGKPHVGEAELQRIRNFLSEQLRESHNPSPLFGSARGQNLILISAESLQAFTLGLEIHGQPVTPRLSAFARESLDFVNCYHQTHLGTTSDAEFLVMQSLHPPAAGVGVYRYGRNHFRALPKILQEHGYTTISACGEPSDFWHMSTMHHNYGVQHSFFEESYKMVERIGPWLSDREFFNQTVPLLRAQKQPFMAFLLSSSNHHPYPLPKKYHVLQLGSLEGTRFGNYLQSVHYFDQAFGQFVDGLREADLLDRSVVVLYGDHEGFSENPDSQLTGSSIQNPLHLFEIRKKIPLLIRLPHGEAAATYDNTAGQIDIAPTILSLLGIRNEHNVMLGENLTEGKDSFVVFRDGSFTDGQNYYIMTWGWGPKAVCYDSLSGRPVDCAPLREKSQKAIEHLQISDMILQGDLIPLLENSN